MASTFNLPELGEGIKSGEITRVLVKAGDPVARNQPVIEVEAEKASMEVPSPLAGRVTAVHVAEGDTVKAGQPVMDVEEEISGQESGDSGQEPVVEEAVEKPAPAPEPVVEKRTSAEVTPVSRPMPPVSRPLTPDSAAPLPVSAAPSVRRLARELGVDIHQVPATGPAGYITAEDVKQVARDRLQKSPPSQEGKTGRVEKMSAVRKAVMHHMERCWATVPHVTQHDMADITKMEELRRRYAPKAEAAGAKLTITAILLKVVASALKVHPKFNSSIDPEKEEIIYKDRYNIGVAVDTPRGLLVPVIRDADRKNMVELARELGELSAKARNGKLEPADMKGGSFTVTNLGGIGGSFFTPIVNLPEVAILGTGRAVMDPCVGRGDGLCAPRLRMPLSLSYDHRIIDGADGARFLRWIIEAIEEPMLLSLEG